MYHSITFGTKNTWDDWHLIPTSRPVFTPPSVKTSAIEIPGGDGALDLTTVLAGRPLFKNRTGSLEFYVENGFRDWTVLFSEIMAYMHGQKMKAVLEDDPAYFYEGRFAVNTWKSNKERSTIVIDYDVNPYKQDILGTDEEWIWDTFNFETGIIRNYKNLPVNGQLEMVILVDMMPVSPTILASNSGMTVSHNGVTHELATGLNNFPDLVLEKGENTLLFTGTGTITIAQTGGRL